MMTTKNQLSASDQVIATLQANGKVLATICKTNFTSIDEVVKFLTSMAGKFFGLAKLTIRNKTQGWTMNMALASRQCMSFAVPAMAATAPVEGRQYLIPW